MGHIARLAILWLALAWCSTVYSATVGKTAIVLNEVNGHDDRLGGENTFYPGSIVRIAKEQDDSFYVYCQTGGEGWIHKNNIVMLSRFRPVSKWSGPRFKTYGAGDYLAKYSFGSNGHFRVAENSSRKTLIGQFYRYENILYAGVEREPTYYQKYPHSEPTPKHWGAVFFVVNGDLVAGGLFEGGNQ